MVKMVFRWRPGLIGRATALRTPVCRGWGKVSVKATNLFMAVDEKFPAVGCAKLRLWW